jgi:hypothetical protein
VFLGVNLGGNLVIYSKGIYMPILDTRPSHIKLYTLSLILMHSKDIMYQPYCDMKIDKLLLL